MSLDLLNIGIALDTSGLEKGTAALKNTEQAANRAADAADKVSGAAQKMGDAQREAGSATSGMERATVSLTQKIIDSQNAAMGQARALMAQTAGFSETSKEVQRLLDRYDPLGTKLRSLQSDMAMLQKQMGNSTTDAVSKAFQGLESDIEKTSNLMRTAGVAGFEQMGKAAERGALGTAGAKRELMVLAHEAMTGNFSKMPGSFMVLAERMHLTAAVFSPLVLGIGAAAGVAVALGVAFYQGAAESKAFGEALQATGNYAGQTKGQLSDMADVVAKNAGTHHQAAEALTQLAASGRIAGGSLQEFAIAAIEMEQNTGQSIDKTVEQFVKLASEPAKESQKLNETLHYLTASTYAQITALEEMGKKDEAAALAQTAYANAMRGRADATIQNLGLVESAFKSAWKMASGAWDAFLGIGRTQGPQANMAALQPAIDDLQRRMTQPANQGVNTQANLAAELAGLQAQRAALGGVAAASQQAAKAEGERAKVQEDGIKAIDAINRTTSGNATSQERLTNALRDQKKSYADLRKAVDDPSTSASARESANKLLADEDRQVKRLTESYAEKSKTSKTSIDEDSKLLDSVQKGLAASQAEIDLGKSLTPVQREIATLYEKIGLSKHAYTLETLLSVDAMMQEKLANEALSESRKAYKKHTETLDQYNAAVANEIETGQTLSAQQRVALGILTEITKGTLKLNEAETLALVGKIELSIAMERSNAQRKAQAVADEKATDALDKEVTALRDGNKALKLHNEEIGLNQKALDALVLARQDEAIAIQQSIVLENEQGIARGEEVKDIQLQINKLQELQSKRGLTVQGQVATAGADAAKKAEDAWMASVKTIEDGLYSATENGFAGGLKKAFGDIKQWLARQVLSFAVKPFAEFGASLLNPGASQAGGIASAASGISGMSSLSSAVTGLTSAASAFTGAFSSGAAIGTGAMSGGFSMMGSATGVSSMAAGVGQVLGSLGPVGWAALAAIAVVSLGGGETRSGATYGTGADGAVVKQEGPSGGEINGTDARKAFDSAKSAITGALAAMGSKAVLTGYTAGLESSKNGKGFDFAGGKINGVGFGESAGRYGGQFAMKTQDSAAAFTNYILQLKQSTIEALQAATDLPKTISDMLKGVDASALDIKGVDKLIENLYVVINGVNALQAELKVMPFENLKNMSFYAAATLSALSGNIEKFKTNLVNFYDKFYTSTEKAATATASVARVFASFGETMPALDKNARQSFRTLLEGYDLNIEADRKAYAALLGVSGAFDQLATAADASGQALQTAIGGIQGLVDGIHKSVGDSIFANQYGLKDNAGKYDMLDAKGKGLDTQLRSTDDIAAIAKIASDEISLLNQAFALLSPEQQNGTVSQYEAKLNSIDEYVTSKGADAIGQARAQAAETAATIAAAVKVAVAEAMAASSAAIAAAAASIQAAANVPAVANISVTVSKPPSTEVDVRQYEGGRG